jgi:hypothetical protein
MFTKKLIVIVIVIVIVLVAVGVGIGLRLLAGQNPAGASEYSAVYLTTGDIYFGKLSWFPWPHMKNVWFLQRTVNQQNQTQLGVAPLSSAFWKPIDEIYLNPKEIILWTSLRNDSQLAQALANPAALQPASVPQETAPATSTFKGPTSPPPSAK